MVVVVMVVIVLGRRLSGGGLCGLHNRGMTAGEGQQGCRRYQCQDSFGSGHSCSSIACDMLECNLPGGA